MRPPGRAGRATRVRSSVPVIDHREPGAADRVGMAGQELVGVDVTRIEVGLGIVPGGHPDVVGVAVVGPQMSLVATTTSSPA